MKLLRAALILLGAAAWLVAGGTPALASGSTQPVNVDSSGGQANGGDSNGGVISADGRYVAFSSTAANLVPGDTNGWRDIFLRDTVTGSTLRVSVDGTGAQANQSSYAPDISADGRFVSFLSYAGNLVANDTNGKSDIFVRDVQAGTTTRVSVDSAGNQGSGGAGTNAISADGRYVAFQSEASNLAPGDLGIDWDAFVHDRQTGTTTMMSVSSTGVPGNGDSLAPDISGDGRYVVFSSYAANLVAGDTNNRDDQFIHDRLTGTTTLVSVGLGGVPANNGTHYGSANSDGRYVAFASYASNLVADDSNGKMDVFVRDMQTGTTSRISGSGAQGNGATSNAALSADGRFVSFSSEASDLVPGDTNNVSDVFRHDRQSGTTVRVSVNSSGVEGNGMSAPSSISGDGNRIVFDSLGCNLIAGDTNGTRDVFLHDLGVPGGGSSPDADSDCDGIADNADNCMAAFNPGQGDWDGDGIGDPCDPDTTTGIIDNVSIDMNDDAAPANLPLSMGTVETCGIILNDGVLNADEDSLDSLTVDVVVGPLGVPATNGVVGFEFYLGYEAADIRVTAADLQQMLAAVGGSDIFNVSDSMPDTDGQLYVGAADLSVNTHEDGDGVLARLTLEGTGQGISRLTLDNPMGIDPLINVMLPANLAHASIVVGPVSQPDPCADADGDAVVDAIDNCPAVANEDQADNESDGLGDVCDPDDDNAGVYDVDETACGADPLMAFVRPERTDGVFAGVDDDGDGLTDEPPPDGAEDFDCDGDGYSGATEDHVFGPGARANQDPCGTDAWPADLVSGGVSTDRITLADIGSFVAPVRRLGTSSGHPDFDVRWDLVPGVGPPWTIALMDIGALVAGPSARPAMLDGLKAFNGPTCAGF